MVEVTPSILDRLSLNSDTDSFDAYKEILRLTTALAAKEAELAAERAKVEKLREALALYAVDQDCDLCERTVSYGDAAQTALTETQP